MKKTFTLFVLLALASILNAQQAGVTKSAAAATLDQITGNLTFGSGKTLTATTGATVNLGGATVTLPAVVTGGTSSFQPLDADLTAIAALSTTATGRSLLAVSLLTNAGLGITNGAVLDTIGAKTQTGTGNLVLATSPTLVTPILGAATATTLNIKPGTNIPQLTLEQNNSASNWNVLADSSDGGLKFMRNTGGTMYLYLVPGSGANIAMNTSITGDLSANNVQVNAAGILNFTGGSKIERVTADGHLRYTSQNGVHEILGGVASTNTTSGTVVVTGGVGVSGAGYFGGGLYVSNGVNILVGAGGAISNPSAGNMTIAAGSSGILKLSSGNSGDAQLFGAGSATASIYSNNLLVAQANAAGTAFNIPLTTASTLPTSGSITTAGGIGALKDINSAGKIAAAQDLVIGSTTTGSSVTSALNSRDTRGGLAFDGTASSRVTSTLTGQVFAADALSISVTVRIPTANPSASVGLAMVTPSSTGANVQGTAGIYLNATGGIDFSIGDIATANYRVGTVSSVVANYGGKTLHIVATRSGSTATIYFNGISQTFVASGPGSFADSLTSATTYLVCGTWNSTVFASTIYSVSVYNLALAQADVTEIYELDGAVPERFKFGSQATLYASDFSAGADTWLEFAGGQTLATGNIDGVAGVDNTLRIVKNTTGYVQYVTPPSTSPGKAYEATFDYYLESGAFVSGTLGISGGTVASTLNSIAPTEGSWQTANRLRWVSGISPALNYFAGVYLATGKYLYIKNFVVKRIGAVVHLDGESDGIGYQWHDQSTNKLDAWVTSSGVSWTKPRRDGYLRTTLTWAGTHEAKNLSSEPISAVCMPVTAIVTGVTTKSSAASSGSGLSIAAEWNSANLVALNAFSTVKKIHALLGGAVPNGNNDPRFTRYWIDPDTANFTGSIDVDLRYTDTNGNP